MIVYSLDVQQLHARLVLDERGIDDVQQGLGLDTVEPTLKQLRVGSYIVHRYVALELVENQIAEVYVSPRVLISIDSLAKAIV